MPFSQNTNYNSPFTRRVKLLNYKLHINGPLYRLSQLFDTKESLLNAALITEISLFPDSGSRNLRMAYADDPFLRPFATKINGQLQVPILFVASVMCFTLFGCPELRSMIDSSYKQFQTLKVFTKIAENLRGTVNTTINAPLSSFNEKEDFISKFEFLGTIFDPVYLRSKVDLQHYAIGILASSKFEHYKLETAMYVPVTFFTQHCTSAAITWTYNEVDLFKAYFYSFCTCRSVNTYFDPTITQMCISFYGGIQLVDPSDGSTPSIGTYNTYFDSSISKFNILNDYYSFILSWSDVLANPGQDKPPYRGRPRGLSQPESIVVQGNVDPAATSRSSTALPSVNFNTVDDFLYRVLNNKNSRQFFIRRYFNRLQKVGHSALYRGMK